MNKFTVSYEKHSICITTEIFETKFPALFERAYYSVHRELWCVVDRKPMYIWEFRGRMFYVDEHVRPWELELLDKYPLEVIFDDQILDAQEWLSMRVYKLMPPLWDK